MPRTTAPAPRTFVASVEPLENRRLLAAVIDSGFDLGSGGDGGAATSDGGGGSAGDSGGIATATTPEYDTGFLTDKQLLNHDSMTVDEVRAFLHSYGSYFRNPVPDVDGTTFDLAAAVVGAGQMHGINPQVLLATVQKEHRGITRTSRPTEYQMSFLMGSGSPSTATHQIYDAANRFKEYHQELSETGVTRSGWRVGVAKETYDGKWVTPATKATAGQFTYTPYVGAQWGGDDARWGGVWLFYNWWNEFGFNDREAPRAVSTQFEFDAPKPALEITFSESVIKSLTTYDLYVRNLTTGREYFSESFALDWDPATNTATCTFPGLEGGILPDGNYLALIFADTVTDAADNQLASNIRTEFFVLAGDTDRDRDVDFFDFLTLRSNYGTSGKLFSDGDFDYDGDVDFFDFLILRGNYGASLPAPGGSGSLFGGDDEGEGMPPG